MKFPTDWQPRTIILWLVTGLASVAFTVLVITFLSLNWETWLTENGYQRSYQLVGPAMTWIADIGTSWPFAFASGALIGGAAILWLYLAVNVRKIGADPAGLRLLPSPAPSLEYRGLLEQPDQAELSAEGFDYPFPKAVLQASFAKPKGTLEALSSGNPHKLAIVMQVENMHHSAIKSWSAYVSMVMRDGDDLNISGDLRIQKSYGKIEAGNRANILFLHRDISDTVSMPPLLLRLADRDVPLKENAEYAIWIDLKSGNPHPTRALIVLKTGKGLAAEARVAHQAV